MFNQFISNIYDFRQSSSWSAKLRNQRLSLFTNLMNLISNSQTTVKILDIGGVADFWEKSKFLINYHSNVQIYTLNINSFFEEYGTKSYNIKPITGDATNMPQFQDKEFDVVFSNSVIEHVGDYQAQTHMANEVMRVGKRYFIQTPNYYFPIEPHFIFPCFQFLPIEIRAILLNNFDLGWVKREHDKAEAKNVVKSINLLDKNKFIKLFPDANLYEEKLLGLTKSFIAYSGW